VPVAGVVCVHAVAAEPPVTLKLNVWPSINVTVFLLREKGTVFTVVVPAVKPVALAVITMSPPVASTFEVNMFVALPSVGVIGVVVVNVPYVVASSV